MCSVWCQLSCHISVAYLFRIITNCRPWKPRVSGSGDPYCGDVMLSPTFSMHKCQVNSDMLTPYHITPDLCYFERTCRETASRPLEGKGKEFDRLFLAPFEVSVGTKKSQIWFRMKCVQNNVDQGRSSIVIDVYSCSYSMADVC